MEDSNDLTGMGCRSFKKEHAKMVVSQLQIAKFGKGGAALWVVGA